MRNRKRRIINRMNAASYAVKMGDIIPFVVSKTIAAADISSGKTVLDFNLDSAKICSVSVVASDGTYRVVSKVIKNDSGGLEITASGLAAGDTVTVMII